MGGDDDQSDHEDRDDHQSEHSDQDQVDNEGGQKIKYHFVRLWTSEEQLPFPG